MNGPDAKQVIVSMDEWLNLNRKVTEMTARGDRLQIDADGFKREADRAHQRNTALMYNLGYLRSDQVLPEAIAAAEAMEAKYRHKNAKRPAGTPAPGAVLGHASGGQGSGGGTAWVGAGGIGFAAGGQGGSTQSSLESTIVERDKQIRNLQQLLEDATVRATACGKERADLTRRNAELQISRDLCLKERNAAERKMADAKADRDQALADRLAAIHRAKDAEGLAEFEQMGRNNVERMLADLRSKLAASEVKVKELDKTIKLHALTAEDRILLGLDEDWKSRAEMAQRQRDDAERRAETFKQQSYQENEKANLKHQQILDLGAELASMTTKRNFAYANSVKYSKLLSEALSAKNALYIELEQVKSICSKAAGDRDRFAVQIGNLKHDVNRLQRQLERTPPVMTKFDVIRLPANGYNLRVEHDGSMTISAHE